MSYAVLHLDKASGNDTAMSTHIKRTIDPKNADKTRTHLNREVVIPPDGVASRTETIRHRIDTAGIIRKVSHNQVRAIRSRLKYYQDSYAEVMNKYELNWGIDGSEARHIITRQYYRDLYARNEDLKESIGYLEEQKEEVSGKIWDLYNRKDEAREKFLAMDSHVRQKDN